MLRPTELAGAAPRADGLPGSFSADDHVRIKLKAESNPSRSDFINASPIVSERGGPTGAIPQHTRPSTRVLKSIPPKLWQWEPPFSPVPPGAPPAGTAP